MTEPSPVPEQCRIGVNRLARVFGDCVTRGSDFEQELLQRSESKGASGYSECTATLQRLDLGGRRVPRVHGDDLLRVIHEVMELQRMREATSVLRQGWVLPLVAGTAFLFAANETPDPKPARINKAIELLAQDQPIYYFTEGRGGSQGGFKEGLRLAQTWADLIIYEMEFGPYDVTELREFMAGLVQGGPTLSGHRTPAVQVVVPFGGYDVATVRANHWVVQQILATGVHGITLCHARDPSAVREFVRAARFPHHRLGVDGGPLDEGLRGNGGQANAAQIWGVSAQEYMRRADVWPLNPEGEILIGLKIEDRHALAGADESASVPGVGYAEWGPGDMGLSLGYPQMHDPPYPPRVEHARQRVLKATQAAGIAFLDVVTLENVEKRLGEGTRIGATRSREAAERGRRFTNRPQP